MPEDNWNWVTGEAWGFTDWGSDMSGEYLSMAITNFSGSDVWNAANVDELPHPNRSVTYIVEYESTEAVPEPATILLFSTGIASLAGIGLRRKRK